MRDTEHMKKHLSIETEIQQGNDAIEHISSVPVEDPFHTTNVRFGVSWWTTFKMLFCPSMRNMLVRVKVRADNVAVGRWFVGNAAIQRAEAGDRFKAFVHGYLDKQGVPHGDPNNPHQREGCRIGARLDMLFARLGIAEAAGSINGPGIS
jgi:hypothetical protein